jgi:5-bromo-4-chloroindolyl phosphate hydrolysis protein
MEELKKLIDLKSIITIILVLVFSFLTIVGRIGADQFLPILTMIITFYFAKKDTSAETSAETNTTAENTAEENKDNMEV